MRKVGRAFALLAALVLGGPALADGLPCADLPVAVEPADGRLSARVCALAADADARLTGLGLTLRAPIVIRITESIADAPPNCVALYDSMDRELEILRVDCLSGTHKGLGDFHDLPPDAFFDSLVFHELTHAYLFDTRPDLPRAAHEYLAYAVQLDSLSEADRATLLSLTRRRSHVEIESFSELVLAFDPLRFAVMAWRHFDAEPDQAAAVAAIVSGETAFPTLDEF